MRQRLRLRPKILADRFRNASPFVYANEAVLDRRTRAIAPGEVIVLEDTERAPIALAAINPASKIVARILDADPEARIDQAWFATRLRAALNLREALYDTPFYRLVHSEADGLPGVIVDRFGDVLVVQPNLAWIEARLEEFTAALAEVTGAAHILKNASSRTRKLEGLDDVSVPLRGAPPDEVVVAMNGASYIADLASGQKTGLFFDQRDNHAFAAKLAQGRSVLDVYCHVGGFGLAALAQGAARAVALDGSEAALTLASRGAELGGVAATFATRKGDAMTEMEAMAADGERFGVVVCDPPAFIPRKDVLRAGLRAYGKVAERGARLVEPGGFLVLCSCSQAADLAAFRETSFEGIARAGRRARLIRTGAAGADHPLHPAFAGQGYLKALFLALD